MLKDHIAIVGDAAGAPGLRYVIRVMPVLTTDEGRDLTRGNGSTTRLMESIDVGHEAHDVAATMLSACAAAAKSCLPVDPATSPRDGNAVA
jgi:hypothetical protein